MEKITNDILNAGLGIIETAKNTIDDGVKGFKTTIDDLIAKGSANQSEAVTKFREASDSVISNLSEYQNKLQELGNQIKDQIDANVKNLKLDETVKQAENVFKDVQAKIEETLNKVKDGLPDFNLDSIKAKIEELVDQIKNIKLPGSETKAEEKAE